MKAWVLFAAVGLLMGGAAHAQGVVYTSNGGSYMIQDAELASKINAKNAVDRILSQVPSGDVTFKETIKPTIGKVDVPMNASRSIPWSKVAGVAAAASGWVAIGSAVYSVYEAVRAKPNGSGGVDYDEGADQVTVDSYVASGFGKTASGASKAEACSALAPLIAASFSSGTNSASLSGSIDGYGSCQIQGTTRSCSTPNNCTQSSWGPQLVNVQKNGTQQTCPPSIDFGNPANSIPGGLPPGPDGKCKTGRYSTPITIAQLANKIENGGDAVKEKAKDIISEAAAGPGGNVQPENWGPTQLGGPSSVQQPASTTTTSSPSGGTTTTTTNTTNNITYQGNTYNYTTTVSTTTGDTTTTTTTNGGAGTQGDVEVCGLPGKPACKIDETGTPSDAPVDTAIRAVVDPLKTAPNSTEKPASLGWNFSLGMPAGVCSPLKFGSRLGEFTVDICTNPLVLFLRAVWAWALSLGVAIYGWKRTNEVMQGGT
ncbi:MAG: hypothetical protein JSR38_14945 [Proteobacteria bacterium]|nr:hypothetical protein [Pseudomonadota bacterium]MBS2023493.1 hypothetical protein [Deltaproteobacteria bacterium]